MDGSLVAQLARVTQRYFDDRLCLSSLLEPEFVKILGRDPKYRYARTSRPRPHEFDGSDAKAVFRRLRRSKPVSPGLIQRAADALWKGAYEKGLGDAE
jgi:hypothetical protein